ncbi:MAG: sigma-70 family RNA polymerase sigma factor [Phycisphaerales bacterium]|nr:sigma-70 family RNA polymerase sigma factor [Phycisphaerales bacterium]MCB9854196.1 sigma-70 family RNA polymerase sigma factor [Phycisphaerales bacterium]MCB9864273.1 sigma-70 family RNA polymerase sigma factor [Phycisphaerales bacterium]
MQTPPPTGPEGLFEQVYDQLRRIAQKRLATERKDHTLQATALVNEVWMRLNGKNPTPIYGRAQFFAAAAEAMRRILIDHARMRGATKRGGGGRVLSIHDVLDLASDEKISEAIVLDDLISRLEVEDPRVAKVVRFRFYAGLSIEDTAEALGVSPGTVKNDWTYARAWLVSRLQEKPDDAGSA